MRCLDLSAERYFSFENKIFDVKVYSLRTDGTEFTVMDIEKVATKNTNESFLGSSTNQFINSIVNVQVMKSDGDYNLYSAKCHLGK